MRRAAIGASLFQSLPCSTIALLGTLIALIRTIGRKKTARRGSRPLIDCAMVAAAAAAMCGHDNVISSTHHAPGESLPGRLPVAKFSDGALRSVAQNQLCSSCDQAFKAITIVGSGLAGPCPCHCQQRCARSLQQWVTALVDRSCSAIVHLSHSIVSIP